MIVTNFLKDTRLVYETSDPAELLERFVDCLRLEVGGFADRAGTHYSRAKLKYVFPVERQIVLRVTVELPDNFYRMQSASFKFMTLGTEQPYQRMGLWIDSDGLPRLQAELKGSPLRTLWRGDRQIPTGRNVIRVLALPSTKDGYGLLRLTVNGVRWAETRAANLFHYLPVNRVVIGFDGAADQDAPGKRPSMVIREINIQ